VVPSTRSTRHESRDSKLKIHSGYFAGVVEEGGGGGGGGDIAEVANIPATRK